jgi:hypothetical protein
MQAMIGRPALAVNGYACWSSASKTVRAALR